MAGPDPDPDAPRLRIRLVFADGAMVGPGKADLLERIRDTGSIAAAARTMGMSYKRAWMLVETMNDSFAAPVVESTRGGRGGARLTGTGAEVLVQYRTLEARAAAAAAAPVAALERLRDAPPEEPPGD